MRHQTNRHGWISSTVLSAPSLLSTQSQVTTVPFLELSSSSFSLRPLLCAIWPFNSHLSLEYEWHLHCWLRVWHAWILPQSITLWKKEGNSYLKEQLVPMWDGPLGSTNCLAYSKCPGAGRDLSEQGLMARVSGEGSPLEKTADSYLLVRVLFLLSEPPTIQEKPEI